MNFRRMCALASLAFVCLNQQASAQQPSQHAPAKPHLEDVFVPSDRANLNCIGCHSLSNSHSENVKVRSDQLYQSLVSGDGFSWFQLANQYMGMSLTPADDGAPGPLTTTQGSGSHRYFARRSLSGRPGGYSAKRHPARSGKRLAREARGSGKEP